MDKFSSSDETQEMRDVVLGKRKRRRSSSPLPTNGRRQSLFEVLLERKKRALLAIIIVTIQLILCCWTICNANDNQNRNVQMLEYIQQTVCSMIPHNSSVASLCQKTYPVQYNPRYTLPKLSCNMTKNPNSQVCS